jgi:signal transduction histidine kinase
MRIAMSSLANDAARRRRPRAPSAAALAGAGALPGAIEAGLLTDLLASLDIIVWVADASGAHLRFVGDQAGQLGYPLSAWLQPGFLQGLLPEDRDRERFAAIQQTALREGRSPPGSHRLRGADGQLHWYHTQVRRRDGPGGPWLIGTMQHVAAPTDSQTLFGSTAVDQRIRLIMEQLPVFVMTTDPELTITSLAGGGFRGPAWDPPLALHTSLYDLWQTDRDDHPVIRHFREALAGQAATIEVEWLDRIFQLRVEPFRDAAGHICGTLALSQDITDQVAIRRERAHLLQRTQELATQAQAQADELAAILDRIPEPVLVCQADGTITLRNRAAIRLTGDHGGTLPSLRQWLANSRPRHLDGRLADWSELPLPKALAGQDTSDQRLIYDMEGQDMILTISAVPVRDAAGVITAAVAVYHDVTAQETFERLRTQFIRTAAHELKTPVAILQGFAQLGSRQYAAGGTMPPGTVKAITRASMRIGRIVENLVLASALIVGPLTIGTEAVPVADLLRQVIAQLPADQGRVRVAGPDLIICADAARLAQVLRALLDNALRFSPATAPVTVTLSRQGERGLIVVADQGIGIPTDRMAHLFDPFYQAHADTAEDYGGMGLGLYVAKELVTRMSGRLWCDSRPGEGSTFLVELPLPKEAIAGEGSG